MRELTKQWNEPITKKFEVLFSDFQPNGTVQSSISFDWIEKRSNIVLAKTKVQEIFTCPLPTSVMLYFHEAGAGSTQSDLDQSFIVADLQEPVSDSNGVVRTIPERRLGVAPNEISKILNFDYGTELFLTLQVQNPCIIDDLITGKFLLWYTYWQTR